MHPIEVKNMRDIVDFLSLISDSSTQEAGPLSYFASRCTRGNPLLLPQNSCESYRVERREIHRHTGAGFQRLLRAKAIFRSSCFAFSVQTRVRFITSRGSPGDSIHRSSRNAMVLSCSETSTVSTSSSVSPTQNVVLQSGVSKLLRSGHNTKCMLARKVIWRQGLMTVSEVAKNAAVVPCMHDRGARNSVSILVELLLTERFSTWKPSRLLQLRTPV